MTVELDTTYRATAKAADLSAIDLCAGLGYPSRATRSRAAAG